MMIKRLTVSLICFFLAVSFLPPSASFAADGEENSTQQESAYSVVDTGELNKGIEDIIGSMGRDKKNVAVALCYTGTGETFYYNADSWWYTASLFKLPLVMKISNMQKNDQLDMESLKLSTDLETIKKKILTFSNNSWAYGMQEKVFHDDLPTIRANDLAYSVGFDPQDLPARFYTSYLYSARFYLGILRELYEHPEEYPNVLEYMLEASPTKYFHRVLEDRYPIAQKYGSAGHCCHAGGIIYTPEPVLLVVMNNGVEDLAGNKLIGEVSAYVADRAEEWHLRLQELRQEEEKRLELSRTESPAEKPAPTPEVNAEMPAGAEAAPSSENDVPAPGTLALAGLFVLLAAGTVMIMLLSRRRRKASGEGLPGERSPVPESLPADPSEREVDPLMEKLAQESVPEREEGGDHGADH